MADGLGKRRGRSVGDARRTRSRASGSSEPRVRVSLAEPEAGRRMGSRGASRSAPHVRLAEDDPGWYPHMSKAKAAVTVNAGTHGKAGKVRARNKAASRKRKRSGGSRRKGVR